MQQRKASSIQQHAREFDVTDEETSSKLEQTMQRAEILFDELCTLEPRAAVPRESDRILGEEGRGQTPPAAMPVLQCPTKLRELVLRLYMCPALSEDEWRDISLLINPKQHDFLSLSQLKLGVQKLDDILSKDFAGDITDEYSTRDPFSLLADEGVGVVD